MNRLATLQLDTHRSGGDRGLTKVEFIQPVVDILSDRDVADGASAFRISAVRIKARVVIVDNFRGGMEIVIIDKGHGLIF